MSSPATVENTSQTSASGSPRVSATETLAENEVQRAGSFIIPDDWTNDDIQHCIDFGRRRTKNKRPSETPEILEVSTKRLRHISTVSPEIELKLSKMINICRQYFFRYHSVRDFASDIIKEHVQPDQHSFEYQLGWTRALNNCNQWKCEVIKAYKSHVHKLTSAEDLVCTATGDALLEWWSKKYSVENVVAIYTVLCKKYINFPGSNAKAQNLIRSAYINLCAEITLMNNPRMPEVTENSFQKYFEDVMDHPDWAHVFPRHFKHLPHRAKHIREKASSVPITKNSRHKVFKEGALPEVDSEAEAE